MKKYFGIQVLMLLLLAGVACQQQADQAMLESGNILLEKPIDMIINATIEGDEKTRTSLGGGSSLYYPLWAENDQIAVYSGSGSPAKYTLQTGVGSREATFGGNQLTGTLVGLYPYSAATAEGYSDHVLTLELSSTQQYIEGSFGADAYPMMAVSQSTDMTFKNLCAFLRLSLTGSDAIESILFHAHGDGISVSGRATVRTDFETAPELVMETGGSPDITLQCNGVNLDPNTPTEFFLVIPPGVYSGGFDLVITSPMGEMTRSTDADILFERSRYRSVPTFTFVPEAKPIQTPEAIDLGLSVKWASFNLGASKPEESGDYYAWGETQKKESYSWSNYAFGSNSSNLNKYTSSDGKSILEPEDDATVVQLGGRWRTPTQSEFQELLEECSWAWIENLHSYLVTGPNGSSIYIPAAASSEGTDGYGLTEFGWYWTSSLNVEDGKNRPFYLYFSEAVSGPALYGNGYRPTGASIRPVYDESHPADTFIYYTSSDNNIVTPKGDAFGQSSIIANTYTGGRGIISFDSPVTEITEEAFGNTHLQTIELPSSLRIIGDKAFAGCFQLNSVSIPEGVTTIGSNAFYSCYLLTSITIPSSVFDFGLGPFFGCSSLSSFNGKFASADHHYLIKDGVLIQYAPGATNDSYTIPDDVVSIDTWSFSSNENLKHIVIPSNVKVIQYLSFNSLPNLTSLHISSGITQIGASAFYYCTSLTSVTIEATTPPKLGQDAFSNTNKCPIYVPAQSVNAYKTATVWSDYASRIQAIGGSTTHVPEIVDLGLSVKWASFNLGATKPEDNGDYYAWGETEPYYNNLDPLTWKQDKSSGYDWGSYKFNPSGDGATFTKYTGSDFSTLQGEDDAATVILGDNWRIATIDEWLELRNTNNCDWVWQENYNNSGKNGYLVTSKKAGYTDKSIFLPAAGTFHESYISYGNWGTYWSSTLNTESSNGIYAYQPYFTPEIVDWSGIHRYTGCSIRPVYEEPPVSVQSIALKREIELAVGESALLIATIRPENATNKSVSWSSSNNAIATVSSSGFVTGIAIGNAVITVTSLEGGKTASCNVQVTESIVSAAIPSAIDLGLSVKWASFNLGASKPEGYGEYFAWGETEPYYSSLDPLVWKTGKSTGYMWPSYKWYSNNKLTKYCTDPENGIDGFTDGKTILEPEDDAAHVHLGGNWRMPTKEELEELLNNCTWVWDSLHEVPGYKITGPNGNQIFLPASGGWNFSEDPGTAFDFGSIWTSTIRLDASWSIDYCAYGLFFESSMKGYMGDAGRYYGRAIRPVYAE